MRSELKFIAPVYFFITLIVLLAVNYLVSGPRVASPPYSFIFALVFLVLAIVLGMAAIHAFWRHRTSPDPRKKNRALVLTGPYIFSRNPMYLSMFLFMIGVAMGSGAVVWSLTMPFVFLYLVDKFVVPFEESRLEDAFGRKYLRYKKRVRRWI